MGPGYEVGREGHGGWSEKPIGDEDRGEETAVNVLLQLRGNPENWIWGREVEKVHRQAA